MKISEIKSALNTVDTIGFELPDGSFVPESFHVTEVGIIAKNFIDCGGTVRKEEVANFQLWNANDLEHRLKPKKLLGIIALSEKVLSIGDLEIEVEYQSDTIGKYALDFNGTNFMLVSKHTACLASEQCGVKQDLQKAVSEVQLKKESCCAPGGGCC